MASGPEEETTEKDRTSDDDRRGREAEQPQHLGKGWLDVVKRSLKQVKRDNVQILASGVAFWFFLALVPTIVALISIYGLLADPTQVSEQVHRFGSALPRAIVKFLDQQLKLVTQSSHSKLGFGLVISVLAALYSASKGTRALIEATNAAYDEEETRGFLKVRLLALAFTAGGVLLAVGGMAILGFGPGLGRRLGPLGPVVVILLGWPLLLVLFVAGLGVLYRYAPDRENARWTWVTPGAILATVIWLGGSLLFALYTNVAKSLEKTYGGLASIAVTLLWLMLTAFAILLGAEVNGEAERQTRKDTTDGQPSALGARDAFAADTVAGEVDRPSDRDFEETATTR